MKRRGFTLVELLIVVAIVGILAALLIPNAVRAVQKAKQKATMQDLKAISTLITDFITDKGYAYDQNGTYDAASGFYKALVPAYAPVIPVNDDWGNPIAVYGQENCDGKYGISGASNMEYIVASRGHDNLSEEGSDFVTETGSGLFIVSGMASYNNDLVLWSGQWIRAPHTRLTSPGS